MRLLLAILAMGAAAVVVLSVAGDENGGSGPTTAPSQPLSVEEQAVADAIEAAAATRSTDDCAGRATIRFLEQTERLHGQTALSACQFALSERGLLSEPLTVTEVAIEPPKAVAQVVYDTGSDKAGLTARVRVADERLDRISDYVDADRHAMERALTNELLSRPVTVDKETAECAVGQLVSLTDAAFEELLLNGSMPSIYSPVLRCDRAAVVGSIGTAVGERLPFLPAQNLRCARARLVALKDPGLVKILIDREHTGAARIALGCGRRAALAAYQRQLVGAPYEYPARVADCIAHRLAPLPPGALARVLIETGTEAISRECGLKRE